MLPGRPVLLLFLCGTVSGQGLWGHHRFGVNRGSNSWEEELPDPLLPQLMAYWTSKKPLYSKVYHVELDPVVVGHYPQKLFSFDDERFNSRCFVCPKDQTVVAKRRALTAAFMPMPIKSPCIKDEMNEKLIVHINGGPRVGQLLGPSHYPVYITLIHFNGSAPYRATQCSYTYSVIVNKCEPLDLEGKNVNVACTQENAWGSNCTFSCATGFKRRGHAKTRCRNDLTWSHEIPKCIRKPSKGECKITAFNGRFECRGGEQMSKAEYVAPGTVCDLSCFDGYFIPKSQRHLATIRCAKGRWNSTEDPLCLPIPTTRPPTKAPWEINMPKGRPKKKPRKLFQTSSKRYKYSTFK